MRGQCSGADVAARLRVPSQAMRAHPAGPRHGDVVAPAGVPRQPQDGAQGLDPDLWPMTARLTEAGVIEVGGIAVTDLVAQYGSPIYILDEVDVRTRAADFLAAYDDPNVPADVYYAAKALLATTIARWVSEEGLGIDASSGGELAVALAAGVDPARILLHGSNKSREELEYAIDAGVGRIVIDSLTEIDRIASIAAERDVTVNVLIRVTVGVEAHTHEFIATAHEDQKFGLSLADGVAMEAVARIVKEPRLRLLGLHSHIGSQIFDASGFEVAATRIVGLATQIRDEFAVQINELNLGGGMGIAYTPDDDPLEVRDMAGAIRSIVKEACTRAEMTMPRLAFEPGRAIVGQAGITIYEVGTIKNVNLGHGAQRAYVSVDGGMSDNVRTALYDADYTCAIASRASDKPTMLSRIVGKHCESGDIVVRDAWLPEDIAPGDLLAVAATGAYCRSMSSQYNYLPRPAVVSVRDGVSRVVLRRETMEDLLRLDPGGMTHE